MRSVTRDSNAPLGAGRSWRRRLLLHHAPLAIATGAALVVLMSLSSFDASKYAQGDLFSGTFPKEFSEAELQEHAGGQNPQQQEGGHQTPEQQEGRHQTPDQHGTGQRGPMNQEEENAAGQGEPLGQEEEHTAASSTRGGGSFLGLNIRRFTVVTGYVAIGLLVLTLLVGPANLLLRRRQPISNYLARDVGTWAAAFSGVHVLFGLEVHTKITDPLPMFFRAGDPLTNSFGLANWTGLAATVIVVGLLAISSDFALRKLKARTWKNLQRLNYALFALVIAHAFFYGAALRTDSPYTLLLLLGAMAVLAGQSAGAWLWRRRRARRGAIMAQHPG